MEQATRKPIDLITGPSGRAIAQPMDSSLLDGLYEHITMERNASAQYLSISLWFAERELRGFSKFFGKESISEQEHALEISKYLIARGQTVVLQEISKPCQEFNSVEEIIRETFQMEADVTSSLQQLYSIAERSSDTRTNVFLDPIVDNQTKSEDDFAYLLGKVKFAANQPSAIFIIDNELFKDNLNK
tara:strand:+ start:268 stop:831 length:564 start_codon:yes stop_codon:yes gene_type:complete